MERTEADPRDPTFEQRLLDELPHLRRRARALEGNRSAAEDLVHDTLERSLVNRARFQSGSNLRRWLLVIMQNLFYDLCRRRRTRRAPDHHLPAVDVLHEREDEAPIPAWQSLAITDVPRLIDRLRSPLRETVQMVFLDRQTYRETASRLGVPVATVGTRVLRARAQLRALVAPVEAIG